MKVAVPSLPSGRYQVRASADDGVDVVRTAPTSIRVRGGTAEASPSPTPTTATGTPEAGPDRPATERSLGPTLAVLGATALLVLALLALTLRRRKGLHRGR
jgi:hypothetical protein